MKPSILTKMSRKEFPGMQICRTFRQRAVQSLACVATVSIALSGFALTQRDPAMSLEQMTKSADEVVLGNVLSANTKIVGSHLETDYQIQVNENLKSQTGELATGRTFTMTLPGGVLKEPPLAQYAMGAPYMFKGEEVVLFLKKGSGKQPNMPASRDPQALPSTLSESYKVVGWNQGRFSVVTRADNGEKVVTRVNMENLGFTNASDSMQHVIRGIASNQIPIVDKPVVRTQDVADDARGKDPLEMTEQDKKTLKLETAAQQGAVMQAMRQRGGVPAQGLDTFKTQVQSFATSGN